MVSVHPLFFFEANELWLDFVNTERMQGGARFDAIAVPEDLHAWLRSAGPDPPRPLAEGDLDRARGLRGHLRALAERCAEGLPPPRLTVNVIDDALAATSGALRLRSSGSSKALNFVPAPDAPGAVLWPVLRSVAKWLVEGDPSLVRKCANERCILFFYDTSKNHRRRWCSMASCGNRAKARAFQRRRRSG